MNTEPEANDTELTPVKKVPNTLFKIYINYILSMSENESRHRNRKPTVSAPATPI